MQKPVIVCLDLEGVLVPESGSTSRSRPASTGESHDSRDASYDALMETTSGHSGPAQAYHSRYPERHREDGVRWKAPSTLWPGSTSDAGVILSRCVLSVRLPLTVRQRFRRSCAMVGDRSNQPHRQLPHADAESEATLGGRVQIAQLSRPGCRRCVQRHRHVGRSPRGSSSVLGSPSQRVPAVSSDEDLRSCKRASHRRETSNSEMLSGLLCPPS